MRINTNISALNSYNQLKNTQNNLDKSLERLSSGKRINRAADDAAGLAISEKMKAQINGLNQAVRNAQDGISMIQTAEGALNETHSILQRMRELSVQSANDANTSEDRAQIQKEVDQLTKELSRISNTTEFNTKNLLAGGLTDQKFQIGANKGQNISLSVDAMDAKSLGVTDDMYNYKGIANTAGTALDVSSRTNYTGGIQTKVATAASAAETTATIDTANNKVVVSLGKTGSSATSVDATYSDIKSALADVGLEATYNGTATLSSLATGAETVTASADKSTVASVGNNGTITKDAYVAAGIDVSTQSAANAAIKTINAAINTVSTERSKLGAVQNRLDHTINNLSVASENLTAANSRVRDVDMAKEMMSFTKNQILSQAGTAMLAQANQRPQGVLQLLG